MKNLQKLHNRDVLHFTPVAIKTLGTSEWHLARWQAAGDATWFDKLTTV